MPARAKTRQEVEPAGSPVRGVPFKKGGDPRQRQNQGTRASGKDAGWDRVLRLIDLALSRADSTPEQRVILEARLDLGKRALLDLAIREDAIDHCRADAAFWIDNFVWQFNPKKVKTGRPVDPFICWDFQKEALTGPKGIIWCIENQEDLVIEKSREMGASWLCGLAFIHQWLFTPWVKLHMISRSEPLVESADPDSLFWKVDFVLDRLPTWLMPKGFEKRKHRKKKFLHNPHNDSTITGEATTGKAGVGGRATAMLVDEFSQIREDFEVYDRTSDTADCRIFNGTHRGQGTKFFELTSPNTTAHINKLVMHWSQHPEKRIGAYRFRPETNQIELADPASPAPADYDFVRRAHPAGGPFPGLRSPWYDQQCTRKSSDRAIAMDLDIDPGGSVSQFFNALLIRELILTYATSPVWEGDIEADEASGRFIRLVAEKGGPLRLWVMPGENGYLPKERYGVGCDLSQGVGATNSCCSAFSAQTGERVAEYVTPRLYPEHFAAKVVALCRILRDDNGEGAKLCWEDAGPGERFGVTVMNMNYANIHYREGSQEFRWRPSTRTPGWWPTPRDKALVLSEYRSALSSEEVTNRSEEALTECLAYRYDEQGKPGHPRDDRSEDPTGARSNHGDRVIADALAVKMVKSLGLADNREPGAAQANLTSNSLAGRRELVKKAQKEDW